MTFITIRMSFKTIFSINYVSIHPQIDKMNKLYTVAYPDVVTRGNLKIHSMAEFNSIRILPESMDLQNILHKPILPKKIHTISIPWSFNFFSG